MCGAVRFSAAEMEDEFSACYCKTCQRWVGGAFRGVGVNADKLTLTGSEHIGLIKSSDFAERAFCRKCGSALWYRLTAGKYTGNTSISVGLLDETEGMTLKYELFTDYKDSTNLVPEGAAQVTSAEVKDIIADFLAEEKS